jgi:hypothetical protein
MRNDTSWPPDRRVQAVGCFGLLRRCLSLVQHTGRVRGDPLHPAFLAIHDFGDRRIDRDAEVAADLEQRPQPVVAERRLQRVGGDTPAMTASGAEAIIRAGPSQPTRPAEGRLHRPARGRVIRPTSPSMWIVNLR